MSTLVAALLLAGVGLTPEAQADQFDGVYKLKMTPGTVTRQKGGVEFEEALIIEPTEMLSEAFSTYGFNQGTRDIDGVTGAFVSEMTSRTKGKLKYDAMVTGSTIRGKLIWTKADGSVWYFAFTGSRE